ncbi:hypothetical protein H4W33_008160 [Kibdelosporangium phytohabitans]|nr:hypothetical protein [Kibdelosporangium phytohabitans]
MGELRLSSRAQAVVAYETGLIVPGLPHDSAR